MIDNLYSLVEVVLGSSLLIWGLALVINVKPVQQFLNFFLKDNLSPIFIFVVASLLLPLGLSVIWIHNEWVFDFPVIVTLVGWAVVIKCFLWMVLPKQLVKIIKWMQPILNNPWFIRGYGLLCLILGAFITKPYFSMYFY